MATVKFSQKDYFKAIKATLTGEESEYNFSIEEMAEFIDGRLAQLNKKSSTRKTKTPEENEGIQDALREVLANGERLTVSEMQKRNEVLAGFSNQKVTAMLKTLIANGEVAKDKDKKSTVFFAVSEG